MLAVTSPYIHPVLHDTAFNDALSRLDTTLMETELFWKAPRVPMHKRPFDYVCWLKDLGASKQAIKYLIPLATATTPRALAVLVFGRDLSPIEELGDRSVSGFIRYLLFERRKNADQVRKILIDELGYASKVARPLVRRIEREWDTEKNRFFSGGERDRYRDLTFV